MKHRGVILWDLENTLVPYSPAFGAAAQRALATMIVELDIGMSPKQAWDFARPTFPLQTIERLEAITARSREDLFLRFHDNLDAGFIEPDPLLAGELARCPVRHVLITHSSRKFADRALVRLGSDSQFPPHMRLTAEDLNGVGKNDSAAPILLALERVRASPHEAIIVDDRDNNLKHARALGLKTVLVGNRGDELDAQHYDVFFPTARSFLQQYNAEFAVAAKIRMMRRPFAYAHTP